MRGGEENLLSDNDVNFGLIAMQMFGVSPDDCWRRHITDIGRRI